MLTNACDVQNSLPRRGRWLFASAAGDVSSYHGVIVAFLNFSLYILFIKLKQKMNSVKRIINKTTTKRPTTIDTETFFIYAYQGW
jgi:hypothetical protein